MLIFTVLALVSKENSILHFFVRFNILSPSCSIIACIVLATSASGISTVAQVGLSLQYHHATGAWHHHASSAEPPRLPSSRLSMHPNSICFEKQKLEEHTHTTDKSHQDGLRFCGACGVCRPYLYTHTQAQQYKSNNRTNKNGKYSTLHTELAVKPVYTGVITIRRYHKNKRLTTQAT